MAADDGDKVAEIGAGGCHSAVFQLVTANNQL